MGKWVGSLGLPLRSTFPWLACLAVVLSLCHCCPCLLSVPPFHPPWQDLMYQGEGLLPVLRLLLLYCAVHGGVPKRHYENLR